MSWRWVRAGFSGKQGVFCFGSWRERWALGAVAILNSLYGNVQTAATPGYAKLICHCAIVRVPEGAGLASQGTSSSSWHLSIQRQRDGFGWGWAGAMRHFRLLSLIAERGLVHPKSHMNYPGLRLWCCLTACRSLGGALSPFWDHEPWWYQWQKCIFLAFYDFFKSNF